MCMTAVTDLESKPEETGVGWKVVVLPSRTYWDNEHKYCGNNKFCGPYFRQEYDLGEWVKSTPQTYAYPIGFHIFLDEKDAKIYLERFIFKSIDHSRLFLIVVKVEYKGVLCRGITCIPNDDMQCLDWNLPTLVVESILVPKS